MPDGISIKRHDGGLYAGLHAKGIPNPQKWADVVTWINGSKYQYDSSRQWLEELVLDEVGLSSLCGESFDENELEFILLSPIVAAGEAV